ncbi:MAG: hypothetical protein HYV09_08480 [Deltaproteobacteria bacterium]|nr:hypothetical protein [Deltaproteobacteria bacterium]
MSPVPTSVARSVFATLFAAPLVVAVAAGLAGCPIYAADTCEADPACRDRAPDVGVEPEPDTAPPPSGCGTAGCDPGYTCTSASTGYYTCVAYDCRAAEKACTDGKTCTKDESRGVWECTSPAPVDCTVTGCIAGYKCGDLDGKKVCLSSNANACVGDAECAAKTGAGSLCLGGVCTPPKDLCSDSTQCKSGATCVDGRCTPKCSATCAAGYTCDATSGLCTGGAAACSATKSCGTGSTCVTERCVDPAATDGSCKAGLVSVAGGCVVDDRPNFFCDKDGTKDGTQDTCAAGSICLHHNCYIACTGAADTTTCSKADKFPTCKSVTTSSGSHFVCGSSTSLGSECDPTSTPPKTCAAGKVCIDGFCK